jgi:hypothetical protein
MLNALIIDVEDYYHVSAFESAIQFADWEQFESQVEHNTYHLLDSELTPCSRNAQL